MKQILALLFAAGMMLAAFAQTPSTVGVALQPRTSRVVGSGTNLFSANADRAVATVDTVARLATLTNAVHGAVVDVRGYNTEFDFPDPLRFTLNTNSAVATNRFAIANAGGDGRWIHEWNGNVILYGAKGDGVTDDSAVINEAVSNSVGVVRFPKDFTFLISSNVNWKKSNTRFEIFGTIKAATNCVQDMIWVYDGVQTLTAPQYDSLSNAIPVYENITFDGGGTGVIDGNCANRPPIFDGSGTALYGGFNMNIYGVNGLTIKNLTIKDPVTWSLNVANCTNVIITGCTIGPTIPNSTNFPGKNQDGIHVIDSVSVRIIGNMVQSSDDCIALTPYRHPIRHVSVIGNQLKHAALTDSSTAYRPGGRNFIAVPEPVHGDLHPLEDIIFSQNDCWGDAGGMALWTSLGTSFTNRHYMYRLTIEGNNFHGLSNTSTNYGWFKIFAQLGRCKDVRIAGNRFHDIHRYSMFEMLEGWDNVKFHNNDFIEIRTNQYAPFGVHAVISSALTTNWFGNDLEFSDNTLKDFAGSVLRLSPSTSGSIQFSNITILNNTIRGSVTPASGLSGQAAILANGVAGLMQIRGNTLVDIDGGFHDVKDVNRLIVTDNYAKNLGLTTLRTNVIAASATVTINSNLMESVKWNNNALEDVPWIGAYIRNYKDTEAQNNTGTNWSVLTAGRALIEFGITGAVDGGVTNPVVTGINGVVRGNRGMSASSSVGVRSDYSTLPGVPTSRVFVYDNQFPGLTARYNLDGNFSAAYQPMEHRVGIGISAPSASAFWHHIYQTESSQTNAYNTLAVERVYTGTNYTSNKIPLAIVNRIQGSGGGSGVAYGVNSTVQLTQTDGSTNSGALGLVSSISVSGSNRTENAIGYLSSLSASTNVNVGSLWGAVVNSPTLPGDTNVIQNYGGILINPHWKQTVRNDVAQYSIRATGTNDVFQQSGYTRYHETEVPTLVYPLNVIVPTNSIAIYATDNGAGKTVLRVMFSDGTVSDLATQP